LPSKFHSIRELKFIHFKQNNINDIILFSLEIKFNENINKIINIYIIIFIIFIIIFIFNIINNKYKYNSNIILIFIILTLGPPDLYIQIFLYYLLYFINESLYLIILYYKNLYKLSFIKYNK